MEWLLSCFAFCCYGGVDSPDMTMIKGVCGGKICVFGMAGYGNMNGGAST